MSTCSKAFTFPRYNIVHIVLLFFCKFVNFCYNTLVFLKNLRNGSAQMKILIVMLTELFILFVQKEFLR